ncbi:MAG: hypothetical protein ACM3UR_14300 [Bacteroidota bacterium]|jgi:hypothetical protein|nr:hypothetical protein [Ignavibacteria bacterium]MCU7498346.1 hypothetical protein [Ignavibacteria bacterium]MCU7512860.1 hypothetical protein [Ignavibacteria bacterium]MCU7520240.1 hypothetical protein [Ignavibacteria bacterium]MCU7523639.1 hypothetical protein [Ignavibacteria bacterium]
MKNKFTVFSFVFLLLITTGEITAQSMPPVFDPPKMDIDVGNYTFFLQRKYGMNQNEAGGLSVQPSWNYGGVLNFNWGRDQFRSDMMTNLFQPLVFVNGVVDPLGRKKKYSVHPTRVDKCVNLCEVDWGRQIRRYRPPSIIVDGVQVQPPYDWYVDRNLEADIKVEWEDVYENGFRSHVTTYAFADPDNDDYLIWKATHKFTGEVVVSYKRTGPDKTFGKTDTMPSQTVQLYWPVTFTMGPSRLGTYKTTSDYGGIPDDDKNSWFARKSNLVKGQSRDSLKIAYFWDSKKFSPKTYPNGSTDDSGDPDLTTGYLYAPQIPGYALLFASKSANEVTTDDKSQPFALSYASIRQDKWANKADENALLYSGRHPQLGRFPTPEDLQKFRPNQNEQGAMRFVVNGPYDLTLDRAHNRADSVTFVYAVGCGSIGIDKAQQLGADWLSKKITDEEKNAGFIEPGKDSLFNTLDKANFAWNQINKGIKLPAAPPPPDVNVTAGPDIVTVGWSYPDQSYFQDAVTNADDWSEWRVYRKGGSFLTFDPNDEGVINKWELVYSTRDRNIKSFVDSNVVRGHDYYYAVTAVDNGSQNTTGYLPGERLESSRFVNMTQVPVTPFKPGLNTSSLVRVVPNPFTSVAGAALNYYVQDPNQINFYNLPFACKLSIFTEAGELVWEKNHYGTADEKWNQKTDYNQFVSSGLYILAVSDCKDIEGKPLDQQFVKFVIIR